MEQIVYFASEISEDWFWKTRVHSRKARTRKVNYGGRNELYRVHNFRILIVKKFELILKGIEPKN